MLAVLGARLEAMFNVLDGWICVPFERSEAVEALR